MGQHSFCCGHENECGEGHQEEFRAERAGCRWKMARNLHLTMIGKREWGLMREEDKERAQNQNSRVIRSHE